jgi:hypothetical protein
MDAQQTGDRRGSDGKDGRLAKGLAWFSFGLGAAEIAAPSALARLIGVGADAGTRRTLMVLGARELLSGAGILARPRHALPIWARVVGDAMDLALLGWALRSHRKTRTRTLLAIAGVLGVAALDAYAGARVQRRRAAVRTTRTLAITIDKDLSEVQRRFRDLASDIAGIVDLRFQTAPGGRGTEVLVEVSAVARARKVLGRVLHSDEEQLADADLRKIKQVIELGEVVHSDASIHRGKHPAQPSVAEEG